MEWINSWPSLLRLTDEYLADFFPPKIWWISDPNNLIHFLWNRDAHSYFTVTLFYTCLKITNWNCTTTSAYNGRNAWHHVRKCMTIMNGLRPWSAAVSWPRRFFTLRGLIAMQLVWTYLRLTRSCTGYATLFGNEVDVIHYINHWVLAALRTPVFLGSSTRNGGAAPPTPSPSQLCCSSQQDKW